MRISSHSKGAIIACVSVILIMSILPPAFFGSHDGGGWTFIKDFQTLITGFAAVGAAAATILVMVKTDAEQERRHRDIVRLSLRPDRLRIERMLNPAVALFPDYEVSLQQDLAAIEGRTEFELGEFFNQKEGRRFTGHVRELEDSLLGHVFAEARNLFSARAEYHYVSLLEEIRDVKYSMDMLKKGMTVSIGGKEVDISANFRVQMGTLLIDLRSLYDALQEMAGEYELKV